MSSNKRENDPRITYRGGNGKYKPAPGAAQEPEAREQTPEPQPEQAQPKR